MKIYEDTMNSEFNTTIVYLGNDVKSQEYVYLDVRYGQHINRLNSNNIAFVPTFSFKEEVVGFLERNFHCSKLSFRLCGQTHIFAQLSAVAPLEAVKRYIKNQKTSQRK